MTDKHSVLAMQADHPDASAGWIAAQLNCHPAYVRATLYRAGMKCVKAPAKTGRDAKRPQTLLKAAARLRAKADEMEAQARALAGDA